MFSIMSRRFAAAVATMTVLALVPATGAGAASPTELPPPSSAAVAYAELQQLSVAQPGSMAGYSRARFPHWSYQGNACDTREVVLARDGVDVKQDEACRSIAGIWYSEYDGREFTSSSALDIDHMVPLAQAWRSGANTWSDAERRRFANDLDGPQLIAVSASSNRSKGDQSPDQWRPPLRSYWCTYSRAWIDIKSRYNLTITAAEQDALVEMVGTCGPNGA